MLTRLAILLTIIINIISCTKADPKISLLKLNFPLAPKLNSSTFNISAANQAITISGSCDKRISELQISKDIGTTWSPISSSSDDLSCSDEFFSFSISDPGAFVGAPANSSFKYLIAIAGVTKFGKTPAAEFTIEYTQSSAPTLSIADVVVQEDVGSASVTVTLNTALTTPMTFDWSTVPSSAISSLDFNMSSGTGVIAAGSTTAILTIPIVNDSLYENPENFKVLITNPSVGTILTSQALVTITNDTDAMPTISLAGSTLVEGSSGTSNLSFTVMLSSASGADLIVNFSTSDLTALAGSDYVTSNNGSITIPAGQISGIIDIAVKGDLSYESDETFNVTLSGGSGYTLTGSTLTAVGTIMNDDAFPTIEIEGSTLAEGNSGSSNLVFTLTASVVSSVNVVVNYATSDGTAIVGSDYALSSGTITIPAGQTSTTVNIPIGGDTTYEANETFFVNLSGGSGYTVTGSNLVGTGTITNDDAAPTISIANVSQAEGTSGAIAMAFTVTSSAASAFDIVVNYATSDISAIAGSDYTAITSGTATITAGQTTTNFNIYINGDTLYEVDEVFSITLSGGSGYTIAGSSFTATGTITNDDIAPTISIADVPGTEGNTGSTNMNFTITASGVSGADIVVNYSTTNGTATSGSDYTATSGTATITAGQTTTSFNVAIIGDTAIENNETFTVTINSGNGYSTSGSTLSATGTIFEDDMPVVLPVYAGNSNWNKYIKNDGSTVYTASNTPCAGNETGNYRACIHGGERRKVVLSGYASCANLTIDDSLGVFDWFCDATSGTATFYSFGLKTGKGLRDLIASGVWKTNYVTIYENATALASSAPTAWWSNILQDLSTGGYNNSGTPSVFNLSTMGTIYFINSDLATYGYQIAADEISIVTLGTSKLTKYGPDANSNCNISTGGYTSSAGNTVAILCGGNLRFLWIEASMDGVTGSTYPAYGGLYAYNWKFSRMVNSSVSLTSISHSFYAVTLNNSRSNLVKDLDIYSVASGFELKNSTYNIVRNVRVAETKSTSVNARAINVDAASDFNKFFDIRVTNQMSTGAGANAFGIEGSDNIISRVNISNINGNAAGVAGIYLSPTAANNILTQIVSSSTSDTGIKLVSADNNIISFYTSANNAWNGIYLDGVGTNGNLFNSLAITNTSDPIKSNSAGTYTSTTANTYNNLAISNYANWAVHIQDSNSTFSGYILAGNIPNCSAFGLNTGCAGAGVTVIASDIATALKGPSTSDTVNGAGSGIRTFSTINTHFLWTMFDSFFRTWGKSGVGFPASGNQGYCGSASCQIWDYRVATGSTLHNRSIFGNTSNPTFTTGTCAPGINGDVTLTANGMTFMQNAIEIDGDGSGNDNTLCESSENCVYAPNIGAYQGEGNYIAGGACITSGTVSGSKIYQNPIDGI